MICFTLLLIPMPMFGLLMLSTVFTEDVLGLTARSNRIRYPRSTTGMPQDRQQTYSNPQGTTLTQIRPDVWLGERPFYPTLPGLTTTDVACKMAVVKLPNNGGLWVHSPVALDQQLKTALAKLGPVTHIVTPNTEHLNYAADWIRSYPEAISYAPPGLRQRKPNIGWEVDIGCKQQPDVDGSSIWTSEVPEAWGGVITACWIDRERIPIVGRQFFSEVVFSHVPSRTLFVTDLWWNYPDTGADIESGDTVTDDIVVPTNSRLWKKVMDKVYKPIYNNLLQGSDYRERMQVVFDWDWDYLAPCHGEPIEGTKCKAILARHLGYDWNQQEGILQ
mmetsp:Transcript_57520/g.66436  ORF Transcript_57520/g.66436 Transcript_57520/m.66436 type:complete len:332 (-) Transcript_57520:85-1080(-)